MKIFNVGRKGTTLLTVVRFPSGAWSYGGSPSDPDYEECEIYQVRYNGFPGNHKKALRQAQAWRSRNKAKVEGDNAI